MELEFGPEYDEFRAEVRNFCNTLGKKTQHGSIRLGEYRPTQEMVEWQATLIEHGYAARTIPKEYGGFGAKPDIVKSLIISEEFVRSGTRGGIQNQGISMLVPTLLEVGTEEQKKKYIRATIYGDIVWCQGYSEPGSGSDLASLKTKGVVDGDNFVVNGQKVWTSSAQFSDMCFILVRTEPDAAKHHGISYLLMDMEDPGIEIRPLVTMTGEAFFNEMFLNDVKIPVDSIVGKRGEGWRIANVTLKYERGMIANPGASASGIRGVADMMHEETLSGVRAIDLPVYRDRLLKLQARSLANKYHGLRLLSNDINKESTGVEGLIVKLSATYLSYDIYSLAVDVMGEFGTLYDGSVYQRKKDWMRQYISSFMGIIGGGTAQIQKNVISERGLGLPREPLVKLDKSGWELLRKK
ncbi:MAG: acyl-CoA dehydrogenase family protein [Pseudomonadales bacterium]|nr:acyl-CoA dehydrogenase family protein [Pseudomonadales bacterium]